jgi:hypothetical protein
MGNNFARKIEFRCSTDGCKRRTTAPAEFPDARGAYGVGEPDEGGWVSSQRGMETGATSTWMYMTCPDHAK